MVWGSRRVENVDCIGFWLKTNENLWFWEVEEWKMLMTVLLFCSKPNEKNRFWEVEEHHAQVLDTPGLANLWWRQVRWLQSGSRASKPVLVQLRRHQGQQTRAGAYKRQSHLFGEGKRMFWISGQPLSDN